MHGKLTELPIPPGVSTDQEVTKIELSGVGKVYGPSVKGVVALDNINLVIQKGEFVTLFGPSGCGKSTLLRIIAGLEKQSTGEVSLFGQSVEDASRCKNIAWIPQSSSLLPWLKIRDNVLLSEKLNKRADRQGRSLRIADDPDELISEFGLGGFAQRRPAQLSGGMRQRASIARGFVQGAPLMLMDEPFSALDELTREALQVRLLEIWQRHRKTVVFVTHSAAEAVLLSDRIVVMTPRPGRIHSVIEVDLPRPRNVEVVDSQEYSEIVRDVKSKLREGWRIE